LEKSWQQFDEEASPTRDSCVAKNATRRAARPDPSLRKERLFRMTIKLHHYQNPGIRVRGMTKKKAKAKSRAAAKNTAKKKSSGKGKKELNPADVRKDIAQMVDEQATLMAQAVIDEGKKGQLATVKYLFEVAKIFPEATDGSQVSADEECLAKTLMRRLDMPDEPIARDEEDAPAEKKPAVAAGGDEEEGKNPGAETEAGEGSGDSVVV
jgi:hypothetical protein